MFAGFYWVGGVWVFPLCSSVCLLDVSPFLNLIITLRYWIGGVLRVIVCCAWCEVSAFRLFSCVFFGGFECEF